MKSMITNGLWKTAAYVISRPIVVNYLIKRAQRTPYFHLDGYMNRWWLFNGYGFSLAQDDQTRHERKIRWLPSVRIHHILREDNARDMHDHPWDARTIILKGWYDEERLERKQDEWSLMVGCGEPEWEDKIVTYTRQRGDTARLNYGEYHNIRAVSKEGVWTLFMTWDYKGTWGFLVNGKKVPWREYENAAA